MQEHESGDNGVADGGRPGEERINNKANRLESERLAGG